MAAAPHLRSSSAWRTLVVAVLICLWEAFPFPLLGLNPLLAYQSFAVVMFAGVGLYVVALFAGIVRPQWWEGVSLLLFACCCLVSLNYSVYTMPQPTIQWLPSVYTVSPVLTIFLFKVLKVEVTDIVNAIIWTSFLASLLVILDTFSGAGILSYYARGSAFSDSRIVFFKLISGFGLIAAIVRVALSPIAAQPLNLFVTIATGMNVIVLTESRLLIVAFLLACALVWLFIVRGTRKYVLISLTPLFGLPILWFIVSRYLKGVTDLEGYMSKDVSSSWRQTTIEYFGQYFAEKTGSIGFGFMSANPEYSNFLSYSTWKAGALFDVPGYPLTLDDIGIYSALYQYGYAGFAIILFMTVACIFSLGRAHRIDRRLAPASGMAFLMATMLISPISMNWFTLFYTGHIGGMLWFMASRVAVLRSARARASADQRAAVPQTPSHGRLGSASG